MVSGVLFLGIYLLMGISTFQTYGMQAGGCESYGLYDGAGVVPGGDFNFAIIGDYGTGDENEAAVAEMVKSWQPEFIITVGDNNYPDGEAATIDQNVGQFYSEYIGNYVGEYGEGSEENRFFPAPGNHDWHTPDAQPYLDYFTLPGNERYYDFVWEDVHFFVLDSDSDEPDGNEADSLQAMWLQDALENSTASFQIVYFHHPPYASGEHESDDDMQWPFEAWGADIVLSGHNHHYERLTIGNIPYVINGAGGKDLYEFEDILNESEVRYNCDFGAMLAEVSEDSITFLFITVNNEVIDQFTINVKET